MDQGASPRWPAISSTRQPAAQHRGGARPGRHADLSAGRQRKGHRARLPQQRGAARRRAASPRYRQDGARRPGRSGAGRPGFVGRFPVFVDDDRQEFWGIVSAVIDVDRLYRDSGLLDDDLPIDIAITGKDGTGDVGTQLLRPRASATGHPVTADVILPSGSWESPRCPRAAGRDARPMPGCCGAHGACRPPGRHPDRRDRAPDEERQKHYPRRSRPRSRAAAAVAPARAGAGSLAGRRLGE